MRIQLGAHLRSTQQAQRTAWWHLLQASRQLQVSPTGSKGGTDSAPAPAGAGPSGSKCPQPHGQNGS